MRRPSLLTVYRRLRRRFGAAGWWPGDTAFEVCVGAILTQGTAWTNVEKALSVLRARGRLSYAGLAGLPPSRLAPLIRPAGFFRVKAARLAAFVRFLGRGFGGRVEAMRRVDRWSLRERLLAVPGIGRETADAIALYAAGRRLFVVDAYTRRVFARLGFLGGGETYDEVQALFMDRLPARAPLYGDFHAQIVRLAKDHCRKNPRCGGCPLDDVCPRAGLPEVSP